MQSVRFDSCGVECAALLGLPEVPEGSRSPAVVMGHGFGAMKESLLLEAKHLTAAGFVTLAIDYRSFGESGGKPRGDLFPANEVEDFRNAITYLQGRGDVDPDRIGIWGTSFGGGVAMMTAALDRRVGAVVTIAPVVNGWRWLRSLWGADRFEQLRKLVEHDRIARYGGEGGRIPVIGPELPAAITIDSRAWEQYERIAGEPDRPAVHGAPDITIASVEKVMEWEPDRFIARIAPRPLLIMTPGQWDMMHPLDQIQDAYEQAREPKRLVLLPCESNQIYVPPALDSALAYATDWYRQHLCRGDTMKSMS